MIGPSWVITTQKTLLLRTTRSSTSAEWSTMEGDAFCSHTSPPDSQEASGASYLKISEKEDANCLPVGILNDYKYNEGDRFVADPLDEWSPERMGWRVSALTLKCLAKSSTLPHDNVSRKDFA